MCFVRPKLLDALICLAIIIIIANQNWSGYEIALNGASNDWTVAFGTKKTKGFGAALWRMLGIAPKTASGSLSSSNLVNTALR